MLELFQIGVLFPAPSALQNLKMFAFHFYYSVLSMYVVVFWTSWNYLWTIHARGIEEKIPIWFLKFLNTFSTLPFLWQARISRIFLQRLSMQWKPKNIGTVSGNLILKSSLKLNCCLRSCCVLSFATPFSSVINSQWSWRSAWWDRSCTIAY